jgi:mRNA-degrading endonuclease RelE of RelBE toxin-antitoxin system
LGWTIEYDPEAIKDLNKLNRSIRLEIFSYMQERIAQADTPRNCKRGKTRGSLVAS